MSTVEYMKSKGITLLFDTDIEEKIIACDGDVIERIILNLLSNSVKFSKPNSEIFISLQDLEDKILIKVKDTGIGIPEDKIEVIFDRFRQVDALLTRKREGSGIGLALVKALVEAHEGNISITSQIGEGTEVLIELPYKVIGTDKDIYENNTYEDEKIEKIFIEFSDIYHES